jgi:hypothetical protein
MYPAQSGRKLGLSICTFIVCMLVYRKGGTRQTRHTIMELKVFKKENPGNFESRLSCVRTIPKRAVGDHDM